MIDNQTAAYRVARVSIPRCAIWTVSGRELAVYSVPVIAEWAGFAVMVDALGDTTGFVVVFRDWAGDDLACIPVPILVSAATGRLDALVSTYYQSRVAFAFLLHDAVDEASRTGWDGRTGFGSGISAQRTGTDKKGRVPFPAKSAWSLWSPTCLIDPDPIFGTSTGLLGFTPSLPIVAQVRNTKISIPDGRRGTLTAPKALNPDLAAFTLLLQLALAPDYIVL